MTERNAVTPASCWQVIQERNDELARVKKDRDALEARLKDQGEKLAAAYTQLSQLKNGICPTCGCGMSEVVE